MSSPSPPTWPDLAYWRALAEHREELLADQRRAAEADIREIRALKAELERMRTPAPATHSTRAQVAQPLPERALRTWGTPEVWR